jgi:hypothetical protein
MTRTKAVPGSRPRPDRLAPRDHRRDEQRGAAQRRLQRAPPVGLSGPAAAGTVSLAPAGLGTRRWRCWHGSIRFAAPGAAPFPQAHQHMLVPGLPILCRSWTHTTRAVPRTETRNRAPMNRAIEARYEPTAEYLRERAARYLAQARRARNDAKNGTIQRHREHLRSRSGCPAGARDHVPGRPRSAGPKRSRKCATHAVPVGIVPRRLVFGDGP